MQNLILWFQADKAIQAILEANIGEKAFDPEETPELTKHLTTLIKQELKVSSSLNKNLR